jgi:hypothetical protein
MKTWRDMWKSQQDELNLIVNDYWNKGSFKCMSTDLVKENYCAICEPVCNGELNLVTFSFIKLQWHFFTLPSFITLWCMGLITNAECWLQVWKRSGTPGLSTCSCRNGERQPSYILPLMDVDMKVTIFWNCAPCSLVEVYWNFRDSCCVHNRGHEVYIYIYIYVYQWQHPFITWFCLYIYMYWCEIPWKYLSSGMLRYVVW